MPTLCPGKPSKRRGDTATRRRGDSGVTLIEMMIVVAIIGLMAGVFFPAVSSGLDSLHLSDATDSIAGFLNGALNRAERRQDAIELTISVKDNALWMRSTEAGFGRKLEMPSGVRIEAVLPAVEGEGQRRIIVMPGGTPPRIGVQVVNRRGQRRIVRVDPMTGVPRIERPGDEKGER